MQHDSVASSTGYLAPPQVPLQALHTTLQQEGQAVLGAQAVSQWAGCSIDQLRALQVDWADLPPDDYLKDGGRYRRRRHASFVYEHAKLRLEPARAHWQPLDYNALHGGMHRWFAPVLPHTLAQVAWGKLLQALACTCAQLRGVDSAQPWFLEAHQFRIDTTDGIGRPTPEGAHRDGVDMVAVFLLDRHAIKGGETRVFDAHGPQGQRFTLSEPWSLLLLDDERVVHETTPIQPLSADVQGWRDTLVPTCRAGGFLDELY